MLTRLASLLFANDERVARGVTRAGLKKKLVRGGMAADTYQRKVIGYRTSRGRNVYIQTGIQRTPLAADTSRLSRQRLLLGIVFRDYECTTRLSFFSSPLVSPLPSQPGGTDMRAITI